jgi:hypothetical protein
MQMLRVPISHQLEDTAVMLRDLRFEQFLAMRAKALEGIRLIVLHEPAISDHIDGQNPASRRSKPCPR